MRCITVCSQIFMALCLALLILLGIGRLVGVPLAAKSFAATPALLTAAYPRVGLSAQITDTVELTDTTAMTNTMDMVDPTDGDESSDNVSRATADTGGSTPENALTPSGEQETLAPRERRWYTFKYDYDEDNGDPSNVLAELQMDQPGSIGFEVWSAQNLRQWQNGEDFTPTGAGTPAFAIEEGRNADNRDRSLLRWVGGGRATTLYYLIVENNTDAPVGYRLTVAGSTVSFPGVTSSSTMSPTMSTEMTGTATILSGGINAETSLAPTGQRATLAPRERRWYTFQYNFDQEVNANDDTVENDASEAIVELRMAQPGALSFEVWSQDDLRRWQNGEDFTPTGAGTPAFAIGEGDDDRDRTLLRWVGSTEATVTYYLIVQNNTDETVSYRLTVTGETVSFSASAMTSGTEVNNTTSMTTTGMSDTPAMTELTTTNSITDTTANTTANTTVNTTAMTATTGVSNTMISGGSGPENAMTITGQRASLATGAQRWYTFEYVYDSESDSDNTPSNAIVELRMAQAGALSFEVWSADNVRQRQNNEDFTPTGAGTPAFAIEEGSTADNRDRALLRWAGSAEASVRYYVIVTNNTDTAATYRLTLSGPDVRP